MATACLQQLFITCMRCVFASACIAQGVTVKFFSIFGRGMAAVRPKVAAARL